MINCSVRFTVAVFQLRKLQDTGYHGLPWIWDISSVMLIGTFLSVFHLLPMWVTEQVSMIAWKYMIMYGSSVAINTHFVSQAASNIFYIKLRCRNLFLQFWSDSDGVFVRGWVMAQGWQEKYWPQKILKELSWKLENHAFRAHFTKEDMGKFSQPFRRTFRHRWRDLLMCNTVHIRRCNF